MKSKGKIKEGREMNKLRVKGKEVEKKGGSPPPDRVREPIKFAPLLFSPLDSHTFLAGAGSGSPPPPTGRRGGCGW